MSIISCTSPSPSLAILPASIETSPASSPLWRRSWSPNRRTSSPRLGAGTLRHARNAWWARSTARFTSSAPASRTAPMAEPSIGERTPIVPPFVSACGTPSADRTLAACFIAGFLSSRGSANRFDLARFCIRLAEAIGQEIGQLHALLRDEPALRQLLPAEEVHGRADAGGRRDLDR